MKPFRYFKPETVEEVLSILDIGKAKILAGGTDLLLDFKKGKVETDNVVDINQVQSIRVIKDRGEEIAIGSAVTLAEVANSPIIKKLAPILCQACSFIGSPQIRNLGTLGGNIANGSPSADSVPALICLDARIKVSSAKASRDVPIKEILGVDTDKTTLGQNDLIEEIKFEHPASSTRGAFFKLGRRNALAISRISMGILITMDGNVKIKEAAIALGAVSPHPFRVTSAEKILVGQTPNRALLKEVVEEICRATAITLGNRASAPYKREAVRGVVWDAFENLFSLNEASDESTTNSTIKVKGVGKKLN